MGFAMSFKRLLIGVVLSGALLYSGAASALVVCQGPGWLVEGDVPWKPSIKQVKDIITKAPDRKIPGNFSCCNKIGSDGRICQDYAEDENSDVTLVSHEFNRTPPPAPNAPAPAKK